MPLWCRPVGSVRTYSAVGEVGLQGLCAMQQQRSSKEQQGSIHMLCVPLACGLCGMTHTACNPYWSGPQGLRSWTSLACDYGYCNVLTIMKFHYIFAKGLPSSHPPTPKILTPFMFSLFTVNEIECKNIATVHVSTYIHITGQIYAALS